MTATGPIDAVAVPPAVQSELSFHLLDGDASAYADLTFSALTEALRELPSDSCAIGVHDGAEPVALAFGSMIENYASLRSIFVSPAHRHRGVGTDLLRHWEQAAKARGATGLSARYTDGLPQLAPFKSLLRKSGWNGPELTHCRLAGFAGSMGRAGGLWPGVGRILRNGSIRYAPLEFSLADEPALDRLLALPEAAPTVDPRRLLAKHLPELSCAVRRDNELVGWMVAIPGAQSIAAACGVSEAFIAEYTELFLNPSLWRSGFAFGAFHEIFLRQAALYGEESIATYQTFPQRREMLALTLRRFAPMAKLVRRLYRDHKTLAARVEDVR